MLIDGPVIQAYENDITYKTVLKCYQIRNSIQETALFIDCLTPPPYSIGFDSPALKVEAL
jgi:hypothetical protein